MFGALSRWVVVGNQAACHGAHFSYRCQIGHQRPMAT